ncbi:MAG: hypothetical protein FJ096_02885 [Deltaproteobacteria bacterium]|nr:hypothetical protein [Deltaproteobacteria bacterium]
MTRISTTLIAGATLVLGVWGAASCGTDKNMICTPGEKAACTCPDGTPSQKTCLEDGSDWGPCECGGESGSGGAGGGMGSGGSGMGGGGGGSPTSTASGAPTSSGSSGTSMMATSSSTGGPLPGCQEDNCVSCRNSECAKLLCTAEIIACDDNPDCVGLTQCLAKCGGDLECPDVCFATHKAGLGDYSAKSTCLFCHPDGCRALCDVNMTCK